MLYSFFFQTDHSYNSWQRQIPLGMDGRLATVLAGQYSPRASTYVMQKG